MKLHKKPKPTKPAPNIPMTRDTQAVGQAFIQAAHDAGISASQGLAQLLEQYAAKPFAFTPGISPGRKDWRSRSITVDPAVARQIQRRAEHAGITLGEAIRQVVRRYLEQEGRLPE